MCTSGEVNDTNAVSETDRLGQDDLSVTLKEIRRKHFISLGKALNELRINEIYVDILLTCGNKFYPAHKVIVSCSSSFVKDLIIKALGESNGDNGNNNSNGNGNGVNGGSESEVEITGVDPEPMEELLQFMYTGHLRVNYEEREKLKAVLFLADYLHMHEVYEFCCHQILQSLSMQAFVEIWDIANLTNNEGMECEVIKYLGRNFRSLHKTKEFAKLSLARLCAVLTCVTPIVSTQDAVLRAVIAWLKHQDKECIDTSLLPLLSLVKFQEISIECLQEVLKEEFLVCGYPELERSITRAISFKSLKARACNRFEQGFQPLVALLIQMKDNSLIMLRYHIQKGIWLNPEKLHIPMLQRYELTPRVVAIQDCQIYIIGGRAAGNCLNDVYKYNTSEKTLSTVKNMFNPRAGHGAATLNGFIYVAGGFSTSGYLYGVEKYDPKDDQWANVAPLHEKKVGLSLAGLNDHLYCVGGWNGERSLTTAECYDPAVNQWTRLACLPSRRYGVGAAGMEGRLYILGGREHADKWVTKNVMLEYDPSTDRWCAIDTKVPFCPDEYFMITWKQQIWLTAFKGKQLLLYDSIKDQVIRPEQSSYLKNCWGPLGVIMINKKV